MTITLPLGLYRAVKTYAAGQGATVAGLTRLAVKRFLKERKAEQVGAPSA